MYAIFLLSVACFNVGATPLRADSDVAAKALANCNSDLRYLNQVVGWQVQWPRQWKRIVQAGPTIKASHLQRWAQAGQAIDAAKEKLQTGIANRGAAPKVVVSRVSQQLADLLPVLQSDDSGYRFKDATTPRSKQWNSLFDNEIIPAIKSYKNMLDQSYLPSATNEVGLGKLEGLSKCFVDAVTWWTTLQISVVDIESIGWQYLQDSQQQLLKTGAAGDSIESILASLRKFNQANKSDADDLRVLSQAALDRANDQTLSAFLNKAQSQLVVNDMPAYMQASAPAGYYVSAQGDNPASYIMNPSRPSERRLMAEVIAFHEGVPGHHLWVAYPRVKQGEGFNSALVEGWAIYAEYLADEMGLYSSTLDRQGMFAKHLWAASRLIVEPGLHVRGWPRKKAIKFMLDNTVMSKTEIEIEVDRYIAMPGQSLSYILGANFILTERQYAKDALGKAFELKGFHEVILRHGVRDFKQVKAQVRRWVTAQLAAVSSK